MVNYNRRRIRRRRQQRRNRRQEDLDFMREYTNFRRRTAVPLNDLLMGGSLGQQWSNRQIIWNPRQPRRHHIQQRGQQFPRFTNRIPPGHHNMQLRQVLGTHSTTSGGRLEPPTISGSSRVRQGQLSITEALNNAARFIHGTGQSSRRNSWGL